MASHKFYVVFVGLSPGIYDSWDECRLQVEGYPGAKFKSYSTQEEATEAFRNFDINNQKNIYRGIAARRSEVINYQAIPGIRLDAIAVDGACSKNPGPIEYRGVEVATGREVFRVGPLDGGSNNIAEYLAIIHAAALFARNGDTTTPIYSDSRTALSWIRKRKAGTTIKPTAKNAHLMNILQRADLWIQTHNIVNPLLKWDTDAWGEIPADFGRKG